MLRHQAVALGAAALVAAAGCGGGGPVGRTALEGQSQSLQSGAAEGALLARGGASGRTTRTFRRVHASELAQAASEVASALRDSEAEHGLEETRHRLVSVAVEIHADLKRLGDASGDEQRALAADLDAAALESRRIGASLR